MDQNGDVVLYQSLDDGDIVLTNGVILMDGGLQTAVYLSLFGGNEEDEGLQGSKKTWWGNLEEEIPSRKYVSRTQNIISKLPATTSNLLKLEDAVKSDLQWLLDEKVATAIDVFISIPKINKVDIIINIIGIDLEERLTFSENWKASI